MPIGFNLQFSRGRRRLKRDNVDRDDLGDVAIGKPDATCRCASDRLCSQGLDLCDYTRYGVTTSVYEDFVLG